MPEKEREKLTGEAGTGSFLMLGSDLSSQGKQDKERILETGFFLLHVFVFTLYLSSM
jgi:hypothetical protein